MSITQVTSSRSGRRRSMNVFSHSQQHNYVRYLDELKQEFKKIYTNPPVYKKSINDFDFIQNLGTGSFGTVVLVRDKTTFRYHAMKSIEKEVAVSTKALKQLVQEKKILQSCNFIFVLNLDFCCKDNVYVYLLVPFAEGGELFSLLKKLGVLSEPLAQFYSAQIVLALEYLHHCDVIHRDVKPENILITKTGYLKLGDFGFSKILKNRAWTLCGTPEYLAPEIIKSKGYSYSVDWWAFGVLVFELNVGYPPFYSTDTMKLYEKILSGSFKTPATMTPQCKLLVKQLLEVEPSKRIGFLKAGVYDIKSHEWFQGLEWNMLLNQQLKPPFIPILNDINVETDAIMGRKIKHSPINLFEEEFEDF
ncbi:cAMP-dependent protein kinase catalytic subunit gamma-like [Cydia fagiglandana]|uniref:cAMP-dependent protein kinase catalytic subunit gamma-like n=1 Tax=Cydia fagiglandana TaxID=1458189 RepID=UPI002FEE5D93